MAKLTISVVTSNNRELIRGCLKSIYSTLGEIDAEVYVVVNGSEDDTEDAIRAEFPETRLLVNSRKLGFTHNHNMVIKRASGDYVLVLNDDVVVLPDALNKMIAYMDSEPDVGVLGCRLLNGDGSLQWSSGVSASHELEYLKSGLFASLCPILARQTVTETLPVAWVTGAAMMLRMRAVERVGMFDENIVIYYEDGDLCYRMFRAGWKVVYYPSAEIIHFHGQTRKKHLARDTFIIFQSRLYFFSKHYGKLTFGIVKLTTVFEATVRYFRTLLTTPRANEHRQELLQTYARVLRMVLSSPGSRLQEH